MMWGSLLNFGVALAFGVIIHFWFRPRKKGQNSPFKPVVVGRMLLLLLGMGALVYLVHGYIKWKMTFALQAGCAAVFDYIEQRPLINCFVDDEQIISIMTSRAAIQADPIDMHFWKLSSHFVQEDLVAASPDLKITIYNLDDFNIKIVRHISGELVSVSFNEGRIITPWPNSNGMMDNARTRFPWVRYEIENPHRAPV